MPTLLSRLCWLPGMFVCICFPLSVRAAGPLPCSPALASLLPGQRLLWLLKPPKAKHAPSHARKHAPRLVLLRRFSTRFDPHNRKRCHNIRLAIKRINGKVLPPGHVFSLNTAVGPRDHKHGFLTAPVIEQRKLVPGIGGGVSQVTGTLFNAALLAGLPIVEYHTHAEPVDYLPIGRDATVAWEHLDMKFKNNTPGPLQIICKSTAERAIAAIYAVTPPRQQVSVSVHCKKLGPHHIKAQLYRTFKKGKKVVKKELVGRSEYDWKPAHSD